MTWLLALRILLIASGIACITTTGYLLSVTRENLQRGRAWSAAAVALGVIASTGQRIAQHDGDATVGIPLMIAGLAGWSVFSTIAARRIKQRGSSG